MESDFANLKYKYPVTSGELTVRKDLEGYFVYDRKTKQTLLTNNDCGSFLTKCTGNFSIDKISTLISQEKQEYKKIVSKRISKLLKNLVNDKIVSLRDKETYVPIRLRKSDLRFPVDTAFLEVTKACNLKCIHCYADSPSFSSKDNSPDLKRTFCLIDKLDKIGIMQFIVTGGEPFFRKGIFDILEYISSKSMDYGVLTNATLLNRKNINRLKESDPKFVGVSFDDHREEVCNFIRGKKVYKKVLESLLELKDARLPLQTNTILFKGLNDSYGPLVNFMSFLKSIGLEARNIIFDEFLPLGEGKNKIQYQFNRTERFNLMQNLKKAFKKVFSLDFVIIQDTAPLLIRPDRYCGVGKNEIYVTDDGDMFPCPLLVDEKYKIGNIFKDDFTSVVEQSELANYFRGNEHIKNSECETCNVFDICLGGCKAKPLIFSGKLNEADLWLCAYLDKIPKKKDG